LNLTSSLFPFLPSAFLGVFFPKLPPLFNPTMESGFFQTPPNFSVCPAAILIFYSPTFGLASHVLDDIGPETIPFAFDDFLAALFPSPKTAGFHHKRGTFLLDSQSPP